MKLSLHLSRNKKTDVYTTIYSYPCACKHITGRSWREIADTAAQPFSGYTHKPQQGDATTGNQVCKRY